MGIVVRQSPEGRMEKTSGSNDGPNSFQQHGAPTRTARAGSRCAHQSAGTFDDTAAETRVPPSLDVRVLHVRRRGLAADWHVAVRCLMASIGMDSFTSLTSRTYSHSDRSILVADLRQISDLALISVSRVERACPGCPRHSSAALSAPAGVGGRVPASVRPGPGRGARAFPFGFLRASPVPNRC